jgi:hypothetical protein
LARSCALDKKAATASGSFHASIRLDAQERRVDRRKIRAMRHAVGAYYFDFIPGLIVALASVIRARDLHRRRQHRAVHRRRDAGGGGHLDPGVPVQGRGEGKLSQ